MQHDRSFGYSSLLAETEKVETTYDDGTICFTSNIYTSYNVILHGKESGKYVGVGGDSISLTRAISILIEDLLKSADSYTNAGSVAADSYTNAGSVAADSYTNAGSVAAEGQSKEKERCGKLPVRVCVKVDSLRNMSRPYQDLEEWCAIPGNYLATRNGRVFIGSGENKHIFHYPKSPLCNPFKVTKETPLEESLRLYEEHLRNKIPKEEVLKLLEYSAIGCFCKIGSDCHVDIILKYLKELCEP